MFEAAGGFASQATEVEVGGATVFVVDVENFKKVLSDNGIVEGEHVCVDVAFQDRVGTVFNF